MKKIFGLYFMQKWIPFYFIIVYYQMGFATDFSNGRADFVVKVQGELIPYNVFAIYVLPGENLTLETLTKSLNIHFSVRATRGTVVSPVNNMWTWQASDSTGVSQIFIQNNLSGSKIVLNVFTMAPYQELKGEYLNGYRIGQYPSIPLKQLSIYRKPKGFIKVTEDTANILVSPHFQLGQFVCKQESNYPKYVVLRERLLLKLEYVLEKVNEQGYKCNTFQIMSGFRTPFYNKLIGNVKYSRHAWGGAADIFIDENPKDGVMDDLNKDGKLNYDDASVLYKIIDDLYGHPDYKTFLGGLGRYKKTNNHGPFVHIDVRGFRARWGS